MKKFSSIVLGIFAAFAICSCNDEEVMEPVVSDTQTDMEVLSRFVDVNEATNEYKTKGQELCLMLLVRIGKHWRKLVH